MRRESTGSFTAADFGCVRYVSELDQEKNRTSSHSKELRKHFAVSDSGLFQCFMFRRLSVAEVLSVCLVNFSLSDLTLKQTQHLPGGHTANPTSNGLATPATGENSHL